MSDQLLQPYQIKQFLQLIEGQNKPRDEVNKLIIYKNNQRFCGTKGSPLRRAHQRYWDNHIKSLSIQEYVSLLNKYEVEHSSTTSQIFKAASMSEEPEDNNSSSSEASTGSDGSTSSEDSANEVSKMTESFSRASLSNSATSSQKKKYIPATIPRDEIVFVGSPPRTRARTKSMKSLSTKSPYSGKQGPSVHADKEYAALFAGNGTKKSPYLTYVDLEYPERNREFDIEFVSGMKYKQHHYNGYEIRFVPDAPDADAYEMSIPSSLPKHVKKYKGRALAVRGPSRRHFITDTQRFRNKRVSKQRCVCDATFEQQSGTELAINDNEEQKLSHWMLLFPEGVAFDNRVFSDDESNVLCKSVGLDSKAANNSLGMDLQAIVVFWRVAQKHAARRIAEAAPRQDLTDIF